VLCHAFEVRVRVPWGVSCAPCVRLSRVLALLRLLCSIVSCWIGSITMALTSKY
jgi:hypothetical protein